MKITVLNGSPKGGESNTMQYFHYILKYNTAPDCEVFNISTEIKKIERDSDVFDGIIDSLRQSDLIVWVYPVFYFLVPSPMKRFIELLFERHGNNSLVGKFATAITTSMHLFDHTSHNYIQAISEDLGMSFIPGHSAQFDDLIQAEARKQLLLFAENAFRVADGGSPIPRSYPEVIHEKTPFEPGQVSAVSSNSDKKILLLTDQGEEDDNLKRMTDTYITALSGRVETINLQEIELKAGCRSCLQCTYNGVCQFDDDMNRIYREKILTADAIIYAGTIVDRYLSSRWKMFFDRFFVNAHRPVLKGKQGGFIISGPLGQNPNLKQLFTAFMESFGLNPMGFVTDECGDSEMITSQIISLAEQVSWALEKGYRRPVGFLGVAGHKIMRDITYMAGFVFQENYRYYKRNNLFDFPHKQRAMRLMGHILPKLTAMPGFRKKYLKSLNSTMLAPLKKAVREK